MQCINKNPTIYDKTIKKIIEILKIFIQIIIQMMQVYCLKCKNILEMTSPKFHIWEDYAVRASKKVSLLKNKKEKGR